MRTLRLHFRIVAPPADQGAEIDAIWQQPGRIDAWIDSQLDGCQQSFAVVATLDQNDPLKIIRGSSNFAANFPRGVVRIGRCNKSTLSDDQIALLTDRGNGFTKADIIVVVANIEGTWAGCAAYPEEKPGVVVQAKENSPKWLLAHEIGHVLGLKDTFESTRTLMCGQATWPDERNFVPNLTEIEMGNALGGALALNTLHR